MRRVAPVRYDGIPCGRRPRQWAAKNSSGQRKIERERLTAEAKGRTEELEKGLDAVDADSRYRVGLVRGDSRVVQLQHAAQALGTFLRVTSEEDEQRLAILLDRIAAAVPDLSK